MEFEMVNLVRDREWLKKEVDLLGKTQRCTELEKCSLKVKRSERRCEELDEIIVQMGERFKKLRQKRMDSENAAQLYIDDLEQRVLKVETALAKVLNLNLPDFAENGKAKAKADARDVDGNVGIGLAKKGGRNSAYSGTVNPGSIFSSKVAKTRSKGLHHGDEDKNPKVRGGRKMTNSRTDGANVHSGSKPAYISKVSHRKGSFQDNEEKNPEVRGSSCRMKLDCRCNLKIINVIKNKLQKENLEIFKQSCFGNLLKINELKFQGQLMLQLLLHLDMSASNNNRLIFKINNYNMEFGRSDFFRITGLHFGKLEATITKSSSSIHRDVFQGRAAITMKNIEEAFLNIRSCREGKCELKLALLYFLYGTLLTTSWNKRIDVQYLYLIEDLQKFNAFPWGRVAYDFLVSSILQLRNRMDGSGLTHQVARSNVHGFCYALQIWAYEVMPSVAAYCASRVNNFENITPSILRWSGTTILHSDDLKKFFPSGDKAALNNTMGKWEELSKNRLPHAATPLSLSRAKQKKRKLIFDNEIMPHAKASSATTPTTRLPPSMNASTYSSHLACRLSRAEGQLESLLRKFNQPIPDDDAEDVSAAATLTRLSASVSNPLSINKTTDKHAHIQRSSADTEQTRALSDPPNDNPALESPQLLWKTYSHFKISELEYERTKALYEKLLNRTKHLKLWMSYAKFEAFARKEIDRESDLPDKRKCLKRARAVFERGLSYFRSCGPESNEKRAMLLEEWFDMESSFGEVGDVDLVRAKLSQKLKKRRMHIDTEDGYEEYFEHQ